MTCERSIAVPGAASTSESFHVGSFDEGMNNNMTAMYNQFILKDVSFASSPNSSFLSTSPANPLIAAMLTRPIGSDHFQPQPTTVAITTCTTLHNPDFTTFNEGSMFSSVSDGFLDHDDDMLDHDVVSYVPSDSSRSPTASPDHYSTSDEMDTSSHITVTAAPALSDAGIPDKLWYTMSVRERLDTCQALSHYLLTALSVRERTEALAILRGPLSRTYSTTLVDSEELNNEKYEQLRRFLKSRAVSAKKLSKPAPRRTSTTTQGGQKNSWQSLLKRNDTPLPVSSNKKSLLKKNLAAPARKDTWNFTDQRSLVKKQETLNSSPGNRDPSTYQSENSFIKLQKEKLRKMQKQKMRERKSGLFAHEEVVRVSSMTSTSLEADHLLSGEEEELDICG